ncbi:Fe-S cluster assembly protein SufB, partial [Candidatus Marsarchaeota archaeon]|nr:Fe-S cluster assembly protein SufB [Candidatus Marsarchaeota archaeon]
MAYDETQDVMQKKDEYLEKYGFKTKDDYETILKGISEEMIRQLSKSKNEPEWMLEKRLRGYKIFEEKPVPSWGPDLGKIDYDDIYYYLKPHAKKNL